MGLLSNTSLTRLDLSRNRFSDRGAEALGHMLENNTTLLELVLDRNALGERGGRAIFRSFRDAPRERHISLQQCSYSWEKTEASKFNPDRPTGHYELDLDNPYEKAVYARLVNLSNLSVPNGFTSLQNCRWNGKKVVVDEAFVEKNPLSDLRGSMHLDFLEASKREEVSAQITSVGDLLKVLNALQGDEARMQVRQSASPLI